ncbi:MAG TPA: ribonuclease III [Candidatus Fermentibacter daniensis]|nr:MAG: hypothetical protein AO394_05900 [Candidatus Fermentibacter daniensis]MBP7719065.1 ribonuclease III [Candidatus Fermentibacter sp.]OQC70006.1 MAG: Ribonuclease 3 [candidate division Hyd24-12 bacterium ADurb.Bin004]KZD17641.1 MAG: hypothetical protein AO396_03055 [Candidatus Fermentibacter daniensis]KZD19450.1 MAG: hypothetical protein AO395_00100 [Candidatus Fermentibacter daniensis]
MHPSTDDASTALDAAEASIGYRFRERGLLLRALTHRSAGAGSNYELLEFLGDSVLELLARELLLERFPGEGEGQLTRRKRSLVSARALAVAGRRLGLEKSIVSGGGLRLSGAILADVVEAVCGAVYLDAGIREARSVIRNAILERLLESGSDPGSDPRSRLQEMCQAAGLPPPVYRVSRTGGPEHEPLFEAVVSVDRKEAGTGSGATKKEAQSAAAAEALGRIQGGGDNGLLSLG